jgi:hypothetical protein
VYQLAKSTALRDLNDRQSLMNAGLIIKEVTSGVLKIVFVTC